MTVWEWTWVAALGYMVGGSLVGWRKQWSDQGLKVWFAVSTGLLWAVALGGMLPHGWTEAPYPPVWVLAGLLTAFVFQQGFGRYREGDQRASVAVWSVLTGMGIHAFFEGVALGAGFQTDVHLGMAVLLGLILHKVPEGMAIASLAMSNGGTRKKGMGFVLLLGLCTVIGTGTAWAASGLIQIGTGIPLLFSAGILIYITGTELWPKVNEQESRRSIGWVLSGVLVYGLLGWGSHLLAPNASHGHVTSEASASHSHAHHHHSVPPVEKPEGEPAPKVKLEVQPDAESGWNVHVDTSHFRFTPEQVNKEDQWGEGHAHLYVNGKKEARLYGPWYHLEKLPPGTQTVRVELNSNQHAPYVSNGKRIGDQVTIRVEGERK
ncbi:zinc transporter ZupT [Melghirimyces profundicolus]|uniref:Zinc transporter ZupT n=1 Tax=Melghirimyces profundicolus TaxID=1242148 RepID=A0A2T6BVB2_9BACL|nr:ZIP family metal transporter [Melghirimyces profundicolus]PTX59976.1 zinc transporter ZupT [Melghirimyces profundicolus]